MDDTLSPQYQSQINAYRKLTFLEKWQQAWALREIAIQIKMATLREKFPDWSELQIQQEVKRIFLYASS